MRQSSGRSGPGSPVLLLLFAPAVSDAYRNIVFVPMNPGAKLRFSTIVTVLPEPDTEDPVPFSVVQAGGSEQAATAQLSTELSELNE